MGLVDLEKIIQTCPLTLDNDLKHTKEAAFRLLQGRIGKEDEREQRRWERDYQERQEFMAFVRGSRGHERQEDIRRNLRISWAGYLPGGTDDLP